MIYWLWLWPALVVGFVAGCWWNSDRRPQLPEPAGSGDARTWR